MSDVNDTPEETFGRNLERLRTEGLDAATEAAIELVRDPNAPSQAKSATINAIFRAAGMFESREAGGEPDPAEMTAEQLEAAIRRAEDRKASISATGDR
ncbi:MAG: hypothetical protein ACQEUZ_04350 [Pseudomonadota bacterium]